MTTISESELRAHGGEVLDRVSRGEVVTVTRDGTEVAELRPIKRRGFTTAELIERRRHLPPMNPQSLRADIDAIIDSSLWR